MIWFIGAGPGATDLITLRGMRLLQKANLVIYAGSLVNPELLDFCPAGCEKLNSASMTLEEVIAVLKAHRNDDTVIRLHTGDPAFYGAIREQTDLLDREKIAYEIVPGVSSLNAATAVLKSELTLPGISQTVIISRMAGKTPVPEKESPAALASHRSSMVFFLSAGMLKELCTELVLGGYTPETPAAVVYRATWPDQEIIRGTLADLPEKAAHIRKTALVLVGRFLADEFERSRLYDPSFSHEYRDAREPAPSSPEANHECRETRIPVTSVPEVKAPVKLHAIAFTDRGQTWQQQLGVPVDRGIPVMEWTRQHFHNSDALLYIGACGIAVRAVAPLLRDKTSDPAVLVMDEAGTHVISLLSGHIGRANELAQEIAMKTGAVPVITTATDLRGMTAADSWAVWHNCAIENPEAIKAVSSAALAGAPVGVAITEREMNPPFPVTLWLRPRTVVLGVGCKRDCSPELFEETVLRFLRENRISPLSLRAVASIDLKQHEPAIVRFCEKYRLPFRVYSADELRSVQGLFSHSDFVEQTTGVDNVCERAAAAEGGHLMIGKTAADGITLALAGEAGDI